MEEIMNDDQAEMMALTAGAGMIVLLVNEMPLMVADERTLMARALVEVAG